MKLTAKQRKRKRITKEIKKKCQQLLRHVPELKELKTVLYVGARLERLREREDVGYMIFEKLKYDIDLLEVWEPYFNELKGKKFFKEMFLGDIRKIDVYIEKTYDVICWWQGPEHVPKEDIKPTLEKIEKMADEYVILACPKGDYPQGAIHDNPHQEHRATLEPEFFEAMGYKTYIQFRNPNKPKKKLTTFVSYKRIGE